MLPNISNPQSALQAKYREDINFYFKKYAIYRNAKKDWNAYQSAQTKFRDQILDIVTRHKATKLYAEKSIKIWLKDLKAMTEQTEKTTQRLIEPDYTRLIAIEFLEWPLWCGRCAIRDSWGCEKKGWKECWCKKRIWQSMALLDVQIRLKQWDCSSEEWNDRYKRQRLQCGKKGEEMCDRLWRKWILEKTAELMWLAYLREREQEKKQWTKA